MADEVKDLKNKLAQMGKDNAKLAKDNEKLLEKAGDKSGDQDKITALEKEIAALKSSGSTISPEAKIEARRQKKKEEMSGEKVDVQAKIAMREGVSVLAGEMFKLPKNRIKAIRDSINVPSMGDKIDQKALDLVNKIKKVNKRAADPAGEK